MGLIAKLTGRQSSDAGAGASGRTARDRRRRNDEIRRIDAGTAKWLAGPTGGRGTRKGR